MVVSWVRLVLLTKSCVVFSPTSVSRHLSPFLNALEFNQLDPVKRGDASKPPVPGDLGQLASGYSRHSLATTRVVNANV